MIYTKNECTKGVFLHFGWLIMFSFICLSYSSRPLHSWLSI